MANTLATSNDFGSKYIYSGVTNDNISINIHFPVDTNYIYNM